jgi:hypothetical protein
MTSCQDPDSAALDNYVRTQLTRAAESYAAQTDSEQSSRRSWKLDKTTGTMTRPPPTAKAGGGRRAVRG